MNVSIAKMPDYKRHKKAGAENEIRSSVNVL